MQRPIIITGFMAAGKTTVAMALAKELKCPMVDLDRFIEEHEGRPAGELIQQDGEEAFRGIETQYLKEVLAASNVRVIALGGGTWTVEHNRQLIASSNAFTVWLDTPFAECWQRIEETGGRRPLAVDRARAAALFDERREMYALATLHVIAGSPQESVRSIISALSKTIKSSR